MLMPLIILVATALIHITGDANIKCRDRYVELLIKAGTNVNTSRKDGITALNRATFCGNDKCIPLLIKAGANVNISDRNGYTASITRRGYISIQCVQLLFEDKCSSPWT